MSVANARMYTNSLPLKLDNCGLLCSLCVSFSSAMVAAKVHAVQWCTAQLEPPVCSQSRQQQLLADIRLLHGLFGADFKALMLRDPSERPASLANLDSETRCVLLEDMHRQVCGCLCTS